MNRRKQLTLFLNPIESKEIESFRKEFNPKQFELIRAHVTLCREDEIEDYDKILSNLEALNHPQIEILFDNIFRFDNEKGILIQPSKTSKQFEFLRSEILKGIIKNPRIHMPHITLMHPRNSTCTSEIFEFIQTNFSPRQFTFDTISLIEQINNEKWNTISEFKLISL